jgi:hypothetical protein
MESEDRRKHPRYGISTEVEIHYDSKSIVAMATDISNGGVGIRSSTDILPGTTARVDLKIPEEISMYCVAAWALRTHTAMVHENRIGFGISGVFYEGSIHQDHSAIDGIVHKIVSMYGQHDLLETDEEGDDEPE